MTTNGARTEYRRMRPLGRHLRGNVGTMIALALNDSAGYKILGLLHIIAAISAFGPVLLYPGLKKAGETKTIARLHMMLTFPSLILLWVFGMGMAGVGELKMADPWLSVSIIVWAVLVAVSWLMIRPAIANDSPSAVSKMAAGSGITHLGLVVALFLMIWKPGL
jgi:hypothetical protein